MILLKDRKKKQGFTLSLSLSRKLYFGKTTGRWGQIEPPPVFIGLITTLAYGIYVTSEIS